MLVITVDDLVRDLEKYIEIATAGEEIILLVDDRAILPSGDFADFEGDGGDRAGSEAIQCGGR